MTEKFIQDRRTLFGATFDYDHLKATAPYMKSELLAEFGVIQRILGNKTWVFDTNTLSLVDITVAMLVFFSINMAGEGWVKANIPTLHSFMERVLKALQWENTVPNLTEEEAVEVLKRYNPDYIGDKSNVLPIELGTKVLVTPLDTGKKNPASGKLVKSTAQEIVIECKNDDFNTISYVHFPTLEFIVMPDKCNSQ